MSSLSSTAGRRKDQPVLPAMLTPNSHQPTDNYSPQPGVPQGRSFSKSEVEIKKELSAQAKRTLSPDKPPAQISTQYSIPLPSPHRFSANLKVGTDSEEVLSPSSSFSTSFSSASSASKISASAQHNLLKTPKSYLSDQVSASSDRSSTSSRLLARFDQSATGSSDQSGRIPSSLPPNSYKISLQSGDSNTEG